MISSEDLEKFQAETINALEQSQVRRAEKLRALRAEITAIESSDVPAIQALSRARSAKLKGDKCPRCFLFDGIWADLVRDDEPEPGYERCSLNCGFAYEPRRGA